MILKGAAVMAAAPFFMRMPIFAAPFAALETATYRRLGRLLA
jgi:hypothetical protein